MNTTEKIEEKAYAGFQSGISCAMSVFAEAAGDVGIDEKTAMKIASGFGTGLGCGGICGCVTGALMALGLKYGICEPNDDKQHEIFKKKRAEFEYEFKDRFGTIECTEMLDGLNPSFPEQKAIVIERGLKKTVCTKAVSAACEILNRIFEEE